MDLASLMQQAALLNQTSRSQSQQISDLQAGASNTAMETAENLKLAASNVGAAKLTELEGQLNTQNARVKVANAFGTNANAMSDIITGIAGSMRETAINLMAAQQEAARIEANSDLFGNPLGWLEDLVRGDEVRGQRDALLQSFEVQSKLAHQLNSATQTSVATQNAITETLSATSIKQIAQAEEAAAAAKAASWQIDAARLGANSIETLQQQGAVEFSRNMSMYNAQITAENLAMARQERAARLKEKQALENELEEITANVNAHNKAVGMPEVPSSFVKRYWGSSGEVGENMRNADVVGMRIRKTGSLEGIAGTTPVEAYAKFVAGPYQAPAAWKPSLDVLKEAERRFTAFLDTPSQEPGANFGKTPRSTLKPEALQSAYNQQVQAVAAEKQTRIEHGTGNPFQVPPIESVLQSGTKEGQALAASKFRQSVLDALVSTGVPDPTPELLMATSLSAVEKGDITFAEAVAGGVQFFREGKGLKDATAGFTVMNIVPDNTYNVPASFVTQTPMAEQRRQVATGLGGGVGLTTKLFSPEQRTLRENRVRTLNLLNTQDYTTALTILMSQRRAQQIQQAVKGSGTQ